MTAAGDRTFWYSQGRRRLGVCCLYAGYATGLVAWFLTSRESLAPSLGYGLIAVSALVGLFGLVGVLQSRRMVFLATSGMLDERQRMLRDRAYYASYHALGWVSGLTALYLYLISRGRIPRIRIHSGEMALLLAGLILLILTLPSAIMAWTEAEPPEDSGGYQMINRRPL